VSDVLLIARAWNFSAERHAKQRRKGEAQEPYMNHLAEVAELVATATEGHDANVVAAAVLHDTVEDTATLLGELASIFNADMPVWWRRPPTTSGSISGTEKASSRACERKNDTRQDSQIS
jgi:HD domain